MTTTTKLVEGRAHAAEKEASVHDDDAFTIEVDPSTPSATLLAAASSDFAARGLAIIPHFLSRREVEILREECDALLRARKRESDCGGEAEADFLVGRAGCVVQTLPRGSRGAAAAASGDSLEAARARRAAPCTRGGAELVFGKKLASLAEALLRKAAEEQEEDEGDQEEEAELEAELEVRVGGGGGGEKPPLRPPPPPLVLVGEQYIVKPARGGPGTAFAWHADGSWLEAGRSEAGPREPKRRRRKGEGAAGAAGAGGRGAAGAGAAGAAGGGGGGGGGGGTTKRKEEEGKKMNRQMYLSVWIPLDDVGPGNGGLVLPGEEEIERAAAARKRRRRRRSNLDGDGENEDGNENDKDPSSSIPLVAAAGTAVAMASWLRHASGPNDSGRPRRAWMPQLKLGAVEVEGEEEEEEEEGGDSGERRARMKEKTSAAAEETWRVPVPCRGSVV